MKKALLVLMIICSNWTFGQAQKGSEAVEKFQKELNEEYASAEKSPLLKEDLAVFKSLDFFLYNPNLQIEARFVRTPNEKVFEMKTSTTRKPLYIKFGEAHFTIDGKALVLNIYQNIELSKKKEYVDYLFLPFSDLTCGKETYIGGRYIDLKIPTSDTIFIDFNTAYNPYCAYNHKYSCPIVPLENDLPVAINAGVKKFHD